LLRAPVGSGFFVSSSCWRWSFRSGSRYRGSPREALAGRRPGSNLHRASGRGFPSSLGVYDLVLVLTFAFEALFSAKSTTSRDDRIRVREDQTLVTKLFYLQSCEGWAAFPSSCARNLSDDYLSVVRCLPLWSFLPYSPHVPCLVVPYIAQVNVILMTL
jgi:hypothetical protein